MSAAVRYSEGDETFDVEYCPAEYGDKLHAKGEWPGDHMKVLTFTDFRAAERFAIDMAQDDYFGCASIRREVLESAKYDWWGQTGFWEVLPETKPGDLDPETPDHT